MAYGIPTDLPTRYANEGPTISGGADGVGAILETKDYAVITPEVGGDGGSLPQILGNSPQDFAEKNNLGPLELGALTVQDPAQVFTSGFAYRVRATLPVVNLATDPGAVQVDFDVDTSSAPADPRVWIPAGPGGIQRFDVPALADAPTGGEIGLQLVALLPAVRIAVLPPRLGKILFRVRWSNPQTQTVGTVMPNAPANDGTYAPQGAFGACTVVVERLAV